MDGPRLQISPGLQAILDYPKFEGPTRMLVLETNYFFDKSWRRAAETLGWQTAAAPSAMVGNLTREDVRALFTILAEFKPDFILTSNYAGMDAHGMFARFFEDARIPYVSWFTDTPRMILYDREVIPSPYAVAATWERAYIGHLRALGFQHVLYMPLATDPLLFNGAPSDSCTRPLAVVGTSMIEQAGEARETLQHLPEVLQALDDAFADCRVTRERFADGIQAILAPAILEGRTASELRHIELYIVYEATRRSRADMVRRMTPYGIEVRGDPFWQQVLSNAGGAIGYYDDLAAFYRSTAVNLNVTSLQMRTAVNQRVFDCPAAGGFLITDGQADIADLFDPETEMVTFTSLEELEEKAAFYLKHPEQRTPIVRRGQARIAAHHTHRHRLETLEAYLRERYAG